jgi:hypothetical protein
MQVKPFPVYITAKTIKHRFFIQILAENTPQPTTEKVTKCGMAASPGLYFEDMTGVF